MLANSSSQKKGFTLIEVLLIISFIAILSVAAVTNYMSSTEAFGFLGKYRDMMNVLRAGRAYAVTNMDLNGEVPPRYGILIEADKMLVFADIGKTPFKFDPPPAYQAEGQQPLLEADRDFVFTTNVETLDPEEYQLTVESAGVDFPVNVFYEASTGKMNLYYGAGYTYLDKINTKYVTFGFAKNQELKKYFVIFQVSGLVEPFDDNPQF